MGIEVVDEWGAILKHQAEVESEMKEEEKRYLRDRQKKYKEELDKQYLEAATQRSKKVDKEIKASGLSGFISPEREKVFAEKRKAMQGELYREMQEHQQPKTAEREKEKYQKGEYDKFLKQIEDTEVKKKQEERDHKNQIANELRLSYLSQAQEKKQLRVNQKTLDKQLLEQEKMKWPLVDFEKKKVFYLRVIDTLVQRKSG